MVDGLNFKDFVAFLSAFSTKASAHQKIERMCCLFFSIIYLSCFMILSSILLKIRGFNNCL
jgi:hypothetical protein